MAKDKKGKKGQEEFGEEVEIPSGKGPLSGDGSSAVKQIGKKGKKNRKKDDWEDDIAKELEALSLENQGGNKTEPQEVEEIPERKPKEKKKTKGDVQIEDFDDDNFKGKQFKKQKGKKGKVEDSDDETTKNIQNDKTSNKKVIEKDSKIKLKKDDIDNDREALALRKSLKGKKKGKGFDSDDDSVELGKGKGRRQKGKDVSDEEDSKKDSAHGKDKGKKSKKQVNDEDEDGRYSPEVKSNKGKLNKGKASSKRKGKKGVMTDSEDEDIPKSSVKTFTGKTGFALLNMEEIDGADTNDESPTEDKVPSTKVSMPKGKTKVDVDHEQILMDDDADIVRKDEKAGKKMKKKDKRKKDDEVDKILEELAFEMDGKKTHEKPTYLGIEKGEESTVAGDTMLGEIDDKQSKKKKKKKKGDHDLSSEKGEIANELSLEAPGEELTVKSAAQKKKEKKEKEKLKRVAQYEQEQAKKSRDEKTVVDKKATQLVTPAAETLGLVEEGKGDGDETEDKKKKKKKKGEEEEKKDKKRPGKKQIAAMQEALKKVQEEEERLRREEEERIRAEEEAERIRQEKIRLEQEKKERKKQKEKEKRERLRAEGKLLTKAQRQARARMEATLAALRQQGVDVPQIGEKKERASRLGDRKRPSRKRVEDQRDTATESQDVEISIVDQEDEVETVEEKVDIDEQIESVASPDDDVKDAWDETSDEEMEDGDDDQDESSVSPKKAEIMKSALRKSPKTQESIEESEEESETEESSSDESESEESSEESEEESVKHEIKARERAEERIKRRREEAERNRTTNKLRSPVVCVLGHVDTGKTKILDKIRRTHVQDSEAGGITQQIGATMVPQEALREQCKMVKGFTDLELKVPGLLIIDTPGHESFSNLRSRGSSLCDIAVLVVDIMHGLEPQTIESLNLLKQKKTPFIVALNKVDRLYEWKSIKNKDIQDVIKSQPRNTRMEFEKKLNEVFLQFATQAMNAALFYENKDPRKYISIVPTSALTGDGMGNLMALLVELTQSMMAKRLAFSEELQATVLEVKAIPGLGTTIDVILVNGRLREGDTIVLAGHEGAMTTQIRSLLMPQPLKELRVKNMYQEFKEVEASQGVKLAGKDLEKAIAGLQLLVAHHPDEIEVCKEEVNASLQDAINSIRLAERGVYVQASTLGSLEALLEFLKVSKIPYSGIRIGPVVKKDVMKASIMLEHDSQYAVILAFDVKIERDAQDLADSLGVKIFQADIIYHLFDKFMAYRDELKMKKREEFKHQAVFPCKLRILPRYVFNSRDPIVVGVIVEAGVVRDGTPLCVPSKDFLDIGIVTTIEVNHKSMESARQGQEVCVKIEPIGGEAPKMFGRHFDHTDMLVSKISRQSIDICKEYFRDDLQKTDWQLMVELKKTFQIL